MFGTELPTATIARFLPPAADQAPGSLAEEGMGSGQASDDPVEMAHGRMSGKNAVQPHIPARKSLGSGCLFSGGEGGMRPLGAAMSFAGPAGLPI
jgi:hypothetical protein